MGQFCENLQKIYWEAIKRILKYLKGTTDHGIKFSASAGDNRVSGYSDTDYAKNPNSRRSLTGYLLKQGSSPIAWATRKQKSVKLSTSESEFIAACHTTTSLIWLN